MQHEIKTVGASGQISLGKQHAGKTVIVEQREGGVWVIKTAQVIPESELWLHAPAASKPLQEALEWSAAHPRAESNLGALKKRIGRRK